MTCVCVCSYVHGVTRCEHFTFIRCKSARASCRGASPWISLLSLCKNPREGRIARIFARLWSLEERRRESGLERIFLLIATWRRFAFNCHSAWSGCEAAIAWSRDQRALRTPSRLRWHPSDGYVYSRQLPHGSFSRIYIAAGNWIRRDYVLKVSVAVLGLA